MAIDIEDVKRLDLVGFLSNHYMMKFHLAGDSYVSLSAFSEENKPSFFVRQVKGHWLFKDFSSDNAGSIIDFVLLKEGFSEVSKALKHIGKLLGAEGDKKNQTAQSENMRGEKQACGYDLKEIYRNVKSNDQAICREYLVGRGISNEVINDLICGGIVLHNRYQGHSWCCFAVFDQKGELQCLDNHQIGGGEKFVLGQKNIFTCDWKILPTAERVFICEGIIDYLSMKTLRSVPGIALLGNSVGFDSGLFKNARVIISALDSDEGGLRGLLDLQEKFSDKEISVFNLGSCKDPNEYLKAVRAGKELTNLTAEDKLALYKEFMHAENKSAVSLKWGINRSYMYQIVSECEENIRNGFSQRCPGRKPNHAPTTLKEAIERIAALEEEKHLEEVEKEKYIARSEFMALRLKWAQIEAAELRGECLADSPKKKQIKKKKNKRR